MADEGLREIQLNGKQLVFLFMAATLVVVVIFLCGVMVGRGVRVVRANDLAVTTGDTSVDPTAPPPPATPPDAPDPSDPAEPAPVTPGGLGGLLAPDPPDETIGSTPAGAAAGPKSSPAAPPVPPRAASVKSQPPAKREGPEPAGTGYVVQVVALPDRRQADAVAARLSGKGYHAFVTTADSGSKPMYRVRVGKYPERHDAQLVAARLEKEEQFKPWITR